MAIRPFKYYLHDESFHEHWEEKFLAEKIHDVLIADGWTEDEVEELRQKMGHPFYEVTVECELDDETGNVKIISAKA